MVIPPFLRLGVLHDGLADANGTKMRLNQCHNISDFRTLAQQRLPGPVFHYIDGAACDEMTRRRNTAAYDDCDLVPNVLAGVETIDMSTTVMGRKIDMPLSKIRDFFWHIVACDDWD
jgi:hypothetical protein